MHLRRIQSRNKATGSRQAGGASGRATLCKYEAVQMLSDIDEALMGYRCVWHFEDLASTIPGEK